ncbi:hypothetical protein BDV28DRAFT_135014 [Aspergillus coremiiformis]|uniref:Uncharacterized protein n=1 Tax=Aspergillus coremiiformis TaxID=138285 RepID=A0A5N6Z8W0_9EURO|nr:hypothetical protein BDV28DRAFT_135014 [Aspergillus coremiiformis]
MRGLLHRSKRGERLRWLPNQGPPCGGQSQSESCKIDSRCDVQCNSSPESCRVRRVETPEATVVEIWTRAWVLSGRSSFAYSLVVCSACYPLVRAVVE